MKEDQNIEDLFRASFENFEVAPPPSVKAGIDSEIGSGKRKRIWWISSIVLLLLMTTGGWMLYTSSAVTGNKKTLAAEQSSLNEEQMNSSGKRDADHPISMDSNENSMKEKSSSEAATQLPNAPNNAETTKNSQEQITVSRKNARPKHTRERVGYQSKNKTKKQGSFKTAKTKKKSSQGTSSNETNGSESGTFGFENTIPEKSAVIRQSGKQVLMEVQSPLSTKLADRAAKTKSSDNTEDQIVSVDSTTQASGKPDPKKQPSSAKNWIASIYAGPQWGLNAIPKDPAYDFTEKSAWYFSAEINRNLFRGFEATTGVGYTSRSETVTYNQFTYDSLYLGIDSTPVYGNPNFPDSITGYTYFDDYQIDTTKTQQVQNNSIQTIAVPLFVSRHFMFTDKWGMLVNAGAVFRFNSFSTGNSGPAPVMNAFTISPAVRVHLTYSLKNWMFSAGVSGGFDLKQPLVYEGIDRKRSYLTPQFGVHFKF